MIKYRCPNPKCRKIFFQNRSNAKYCSVSCARSGSPTRKRTRKILRCYGCKHKFERHLSQIKKNTTGKFFCSTNCWYKYNNGFRHYLWNGGQDGRMCQEYRIWRKHVLLRDKYRCRLCYGNNKLEVHHITRFNDNKQIRWNLSNGISLCNECHKSIMGKEYEYVDFFKNIIHIPFHIWDFNMKEYRLECRQLNKLAKQLGVRFR